MASSNSITGYSLYNPIQHEKRKSNPLHDEGLLFPKFPNKKFEIIYADPPWDYNGKLQFDNTLNKKINSDYQKKIFVSSASFKYPTMKLDMMMEIPVKDIVDDNCILFMWTTNPHLEPAIKLGNAWGFKYKQLPLSEIR